MERNHENCRFPVAFWIRLAGLLMFICYCGSRHASAEVVLSRDWSLWACHERFGEEVFIPFTAPSTFLFQDSTGRISGGQAEATDAQLAETGEPANVSEREALPRHFRLPAGAVLRDRSLALPLWIHQDRRGRLSADAYVSMRDWPEGKRFEVPPSLWLSELTDSGVGLAFEKDRYRFRATVKGQSPALGSYESFSTSVSNLDPIYGIEWQWRGWETQ